MADENKAAIGGAGGCEVLVEALRSHMGNAAVARAACGALRNMAANNGVGCCVLCCFGVGQ